MKCLHYRRPSTRGSMPRAAAGLQDRANAPERPLPMGSAAIQNVIEMLVNRLRKKIAAVIIHTRRGWRYELSEV